MRLSVSTLLAALALPLAAQNAGINRQFGTNCRAIFSRAPSRIDSRAHCVQMRTSAMQELTLRPAGATH